MRRAHTQHTHGLRLKEIESFVVVVGRAFYNVSFPPPPPIIIGTPQFAPSGLFAFFSSPFLLAFCPIPIARGVSGSSVGWPCVFFAISRTVSSFFALWIFTREKGERTERRAGVLMVWYGCGRCRTRHAHAHTITINDQRHVAQLFSRPPPHGERERERPFACARHKARYWKNPRTHVCIKTRRKQTQSVG